jgi:hypothetical protein
MPIFYFTISHELQFNYIFNLTQAIPYKLDSCIIGFIKFFGTFLKGFIMPSYRWLMFKTKQKSQERMRQISLSHFQSNKVGRKSYHELKNSLFLKKMTSLELKNIE